MAETHTIVVGATGHRVFADVQEIRNGVDHVIRSLEKRNPGHRLDVMSALAEGADRLIAEAILEGPESRLIAVLPVLAADYLADFTTAESVSEFERLLSWADDVVVMPGRDSRDESYEAAAQYIVDHCDVLVAIWDGRNAQGRGGTGDTLSRARTARLPIAWIKAGNRRPGTMNPTVDDAQGSVVFENI